MDRGLRKDEGTQALDGTAACGGKLTAPPHPLAGLPAPETIPHPASTAAIPDDATCFQLWDRYDMLPNVRRHSILVAHIATMLAERATRMGMPVNTHEVRASALLHDIAKTYCVRHGGSHAQLGASWTIIETGNRVLAQGVALHVFWPWALPKDAAVCTLPFFVLYADKRVRHDACVSLDERYEDLLTRYGKTSDALHGIRRACQQGRDIELLLADHLAWRPEDIECPPDLFDLPQVNPSAGDRCP
jgi:putative nucleotidyltransferase with HDIG domain